LRILHIIGPTNPSGATNHVLLLSKALQQRGHEVMVLCPPINRLPGELQSAGIPLEPGYLRARPFLSGLPKYVRLIRNHKFDLIHSHMTRAAYCAALLGKLTRRPVAASVHTVTADMVYRIILPHGNNRIVAVSNYVREMLLQQGIAGRYLHTVYNGTDFPLSTDDLGSASNSAERAAVRAELDLPPTAELVALFGHLGGPKGHALLVSAAREIVSARPEARFVFVGDVPTDVDREIKALAGSEGVSDLLRFTGYRRDVPRLMKAMDVITVPSVIEALGMVVVEAMAMGKPVVGAKVGGIPELIVEGETGLLVERTPAALARAVIELLKDPGRRAAMGKAGQARVNEHFTVNAMADNMEALYREMLGSRQGGQGSSTASCG
jgi:glycosyltransferase involved in cell wall biosynthesis